MHHSPLFLPPPLPWAITGPPPLPPTTLSLSLSLPHFHSLVRSRIAHKGITFHWRRRNRALFLPPLPPLTTRSYSDLVPPLPLILLLPHCILIWCTFLPFLPCFISPFLSPLPKVGFPHFGWTLSSFFLPSDFCFRSCRTLQSFFRTCHECCCFDHFTALFLIWRNNFFLFMEKFAVSLFSSDLILPLSFFVFQILFWLFSFWWCWKKK